jgi:hypothetical protein
VELFHQYHHHVHEGLGVFPVPWSSRWSWSLHFFFGRPMFLSPFGLYYSACFGSLFMSILCMCCSHFSWHCFISFTMFCAPVLIQWTVNQYFAYPPPNQFHLHRGTCRCIVPRAVYTVKKCSWGWANLSPETCRSDLKRLINK